MKFSLHREMSSISAFHLLFRLEIKLYLGVRRIKFFEHVKMCSLVKLFFGIENNFQLNVYIFRSFFKKTFIMFK